MTNQSNKQIAILAILKAYTNVSIEQVESGKLFVAEKSLIEKLDGDQKQKINALDLDKPKPSASPQKTYVEKMMGKSRDGFNELQFEF